MNIDVLYALVQISGEHSSVFLLPINLEMELAVLQRGSICWTLVDTVLLKINPKCLHPFTLVALYNFRNSDGYILISPYSLNLRAPNY